MNLTHLYVRSEYSILKSVCHIDELVDTANRLGYHSLGVCDEGTMYGTLKFYKACKKQNIKPLIGLKITYSFNNETSDLILYAVNQIGYQNILKISSRYVIKGKAPIDIKDLERYNQGVLAITPGSENVIFKYAVNDDMERLYQHYNSLKSLYNHLYLGVCLSTGIEKVNFHKVVNCYKNLGAKSVALNPTYYLKYDDVDAYRVLRNFEQDEVVELEERERNAYFLDLDEFSFLFEQYPDLLEETENIVNLCNVEIKFGEIQIPCYKDGLDADIYLHDLAYTGLKKRLQSIPGANVRIYQERLIKELDVIKRMGYSDYFLIVWDYVKFAIKSGIIVGPGRGSAGASLVAYCLGITNVDPIKHNLLFERFLNIERVSMPDIDVDFQNDRRSEVVKYVVDKYGINHVSHIGSFGTLKNSSAIGKVARVLNIEKRHLEQVNRYIKGEDRDSNAELKELTLKEIVSRSNELRQLMNEYEDINDLLVTACKLNNLPVELKAHDPGVLITKNNIVNYSALAPGKDNIYQTQLDSFDVESLGLLKMDFLVLENLQNIGKTVEAIKKVYPDFSLPKEENDQLVYKMLASGNVQGLFQVDSQGMKDVLVRLRTSSFTDVLNAIALYRPGPKDMIPSFVDRKFGREKITYLHPDLEPILKETYGILVYQEQVMEIAWKFAGYSLGKADILRRAISKKKKEILEAERVEFVNACVRRGYLKDVAEHIYDAIAKFGDYGFCKAHGVAYTKFVYLTAYLKCHYPAFYIPVLLNHDKKALSSYYKDILRLNVKLYSPDINISTHEFINYNGGIMPPLSLIEGFSDETAKLIVEEREKNGLFKSFKDFVYRTKDIVSIGELAKLVYSCSLDSFGLTKLSMQETAKKHLDMIEFEGLPGIIPVEYSKEEYPYGILLEREKEMIGVNIKYNFFSQFSSVYASKKVIPLRSLRNNMMCSSLVLITSVKEITTKNGDKMAFLSGSDEACDIDIVVFPESYKQYNWIKEGIVGIINGNVGTNRNGQLQIVLNSFQKL